MELVLKNHNNTVIEENLDNEKLVDDYQIEDGYILHVNDTNPLSETKD